MTDCWRKPWRSSPGTTRRLGCCWVSFNTPAVPCGSEATADQYRRADDTRRRYAAAAGALDAAVGAIVGALDKHSMLDNTLLVFQSDNGALPTRFATGD